MDWKIYVFNLPQMLKKLTMKVCLLSDLHLGNNKDNPVFHKISLDYAEWVKSQMHEKDCDILVIAGDFFHSRTSISLSTLDTGHKFLDILKDTEIYITTGNHDAFYLDNSEVTSLSVFKTRKNVHIIDKLTRVDNMTLCPWGTVIDDIPASKIVIGHWDAVSFEVAAGKISTHGINVSELMKKCDLAFSGHYHKPQERRYDGKLFRYLGSTFQMNWGEQGEDKFIYFLDTKTLEVEKVKNDISPRFEYIRNRSDFSKVDGNFISVEIENPEDFNITVNQYKNLKALDVRTVLKPLKITSEQISAEIAEDSAPNNPMHDAIDEYLENLPDISDDLKKILADKIRVIYSKCL
jgi:DNA repair exonuclease SbcCD nuclease subunit